MAANQYKPSQRDDARVPEAKPQSPGLRCSSACQAKSHRTFGECMRDKGLHLNPQLADTARSKAWDRDLQFYRDARSQGIQPDGTTRDKVQQAVEISNQTGVPYGVR